MSNITKNHKVGIFAVFIASALMLGTISVSGLDSAFATDYKEKDREHDYKEKDREHDYKGKDKSKDSEVEQEIEMNQAIKQDSQCITGVISALCGNNVGLNLQANLGNQAAGQQ
jgi:hypothetical protein